MSQQNKNVNQSNPKIKWPEKKGSDLLMAQLISFLFIVWFLLVGSLRTGAALVITSPQDGATFNEGDQITVRAQPSPNDPSLISVGFIVGNPEGGGCDEEITQPPYECLLTIPPGTPSKIVIRAIGEPQNGEGVLSQLVTINVRTPQTVTLQKLRVNDDQRKLFIDIGDSEQLYIYGQFSDGNQRNIAASASGTTYQTSNPKTAVVDTEGLVMAVAPGKAVITIKNGDKQLQIQVNVKR